MANSLEDKKQRLANVLRKLKPLYSKDPIEIDYETPFQLIVGVILSAQCTDKRVNQETAKFFPKLKTPEDFLALDPSALEDLIRPLGFFRNKTKNILGCARMIVDDYHGEIPQTMSELVKLPGFGRKTANVILHALYGKNEGVCVDTHVLRLSALLKLTKNKDAIKVERDLMELAPKNRWHEVSHYLILHGRRVCFARRPHCGECVITAFCPSSLERAQGKN